MKIQEIQRTAPGADIEFDERDTELKGAKPVPGDRRFVYIIEKMSGWDTWGVGGGTDFRVYFYDKSAANKDGSPLIAWMGFRYTKLFGIKNAIQVSNVILDSRYRGQGIGVLMYTTLLQSGYVIFADESQTPQARKLWVKLNQTPGVQVNGIIKMMRNYFDPEVAGSFQGVARANQKKLQSLNAQPMIDYSNLGEYASVPFTFPVKSVQGGKELGATGINFYHGNNSQPHDYVYLYAKWVG